MIQSVRLTDLLPAHPHILFLLHDHSDPNVITVYQSAQLPLILTMPTLSCTFPNSRTQCFNISSLVPCLLRHLQDSLSPNTCF